MPHMHHTVEIDRPPADVFASLTAFDRIPEWIPGIDRAYAESDEPLGPGSTFAEEFRLLGRPRRIVGTVVEHEPGRRLVYRYDTGPIPGVWSYTVQPAGPATRLEFTLEVPGAGRALVFPLIRREVRKNLESFRRWAQAT